MAAESEYADLKIEPGSDWTEKRSVTQKDCSACGETHEIDYYPLRDAPLHVGEKTINDHVGDCYLLSVGLCPEADRLVHIYATKDGWECPPDCSLDHVEA